MALAAVRVKVREASAETRDGNSVADGELDDLSPRGLRRLELRGKVLVEEERGQVGVAVVRGLDAVEEHGTDDAAALPDAADLSEVESPVVSDRRLADDVHALRIAADLRGVEGLVHHVDELLLVHRGRVRLPREQLRALDAVVAEPAEVASIERRADRGDRNAQLGRLLDGPLAGALHARLVENAVDNLALAGERVLHGEDLGRNLNEERRQVAAVPLGKHLRELLVREAANRAQNVVSLRNQLHVAVLNPVVDHLDVVAGATGPNIRDAGPVVDLRGDLLEDQLEGSVGLAGAARHEGRAMARARFAAGHAHSDIQKALGGHLRRAPLRVPHVLCVDT
eukprot:Opistho-1_new@69315